MQVFEVFRSIETRKITGKTIGELLKPEKVLIISDDDARILFLYFGNKSSLVLQWIAKKLAKDIRVFMRGFYSIKELSDDAAINSLKNLSISDSGRIPEVIREDSIIPFEKLPLQAENKPITGNEISPLDSTGRTKLELDKINLFDSSKLSDVISQIKTVNTGSNQRTEMVLVGDTMYIPSTELTSFIKTRQEDQRLSKLGPLPEGIFFMPNYSSRLHIKNGKMVALEFLNSSEHQTEGKINAPLLYINRIMTERKIETLQQAFKMPNEEPIEQVIEKVRAQKASMQAKGDSNAK